MSLVAEWRHYARANRFIAAVADRLRPVYRILRTAYLRRVHPQGGYVAGNGVRIFVDFENPIYAWYDADAPNLAFDQRVFRSLIAQSDGSVFIDVGAHYGFYTASLVQALAKRRPPARVIAMEPDPGSYRCLERTAQQLQSGVELKLLRMALGDFDGEVRLYRTPTATCAHTYSDPSSSDFGSATIRRLDTAAAEFLCDGERIALIKVDIDGAEPAFLRGAAETLRRHRPLVFIEFGPSGLRSAGTDPQDFFNRLCDSFRVYWSAWQHATVRPVTKGDYEEIITGVGEGVTDLVLSNRPLWFPLL